MMMDTLMKLILVEDANMKLILVDVKIKKMCECHFAHGSPMNYAIFV